MQLTPTILAFVILACLLLTQVSGTFKPASFRPFTGWQKLAGAIALILALLIVLNPEFLALGLVGDTAFLIYWFWQSHFNCKELAHAPGGASVLRFPDLFIGCSLRDRRLRRFF
jgi:hypothetical protein